MPKMTLGEAAKVSGFSKPTISRAIKNGQLSAEQLDNRSYQIEPSELERWQNSSDHRNQKGKASVTEKRSESEPSQETELALLKQENNHLREKMEIYRDRLKQADNEKEQLTRLLAASPRKKRFWIF